MMNAEQAELTAEARFPGYAAEAMCTCGVYRIALAPKLPAVRPEETAEAAAKAFELTDPRLYGEGSSYESALAAVQPPPIAELRRR